MSGYSRATGKLPAAHTSHAYVDDGEGYDDAQGPYAEEDAVDEAYDDERYYEDPEPHSQPPPKYARGVNQTPLHAVPGDPYTPAYPPSTQRTSRSRQHTVHNVTLAGLIKHETPVNSPGRRRRQTLPETPWTKIYNYTLARSIAPLPGHNTVFDRLSNPNNFTGVYRQRFVTGSGTLNAAASDGIVRDLSQIVRAEARGSTFVRHNGLAWDFSRAHGNIQDTPAQRMCTDTTVYRPPVQQTYIL